MNFQSKPMGGMMKNVYPFLFMLILFAVSLNLFDCGHNLSTYQHLRNPQINDIPDQPMLEVTMQGSPELTAKSSFKKLYQTFYKMKRTHRDLRANAPRARWPMSFDTPTDEWIGIFGVPLNVPVQDLPEMATEKPEAKIVTWNYGPTAEILHIGSYEAEMETVGILMEFIEENGYKVAGAHEEEYLKGPGMFFMGNPKKYQTIIRYSIEKK